MKKVTLSKREILDFYNTAKAMTMVVGPKWGYSTARNVGTLKPIVEALQEAQQFGKNDEQFKEYEKKRQELIQEFSIGADGKPYISNQGGQPVRSVAPENMASFIAAIENLKGAYPELIKAMEKHVQEFEESLSDTEEIEFRVIKVKDFPEGLQQNHYNTLWPQMEDPEEAKADKGPEKPE